MHSLNVLHLDIQPANVVFMSPKSHILKLMDLGQARIYKPGEALRLSYSTLEFSAPEIALNDTVNKATDLWSIGVIANLMLTGVSPFKCENDQETRKSVAGGDFNFAHPGWEVISVEALDFVDRFAVSGFLQRSN